MKKFLKFVAIPIGTYALIVAIVCIFKFANKNRYVAIVVAEDRNPYGSVVLRSDKIHVIDTCTGESKKTTW